VNGGRILGRAPADTPASVELATPIEGQQFHDPKNLAMAVAVEAGELMDHFRWVARDRALAALDDAHTRAGVEDEAR